MDDLFSGSESNVEHSVYAGFDGDDEEITQEDAWVVIGKYFDEKGLVRQQLASFDEFITNTVQELIDDSGEIRVAPEDQFVAGQDVEADKVNATIQFLAHVLTVTAVYVCG